MKGHWMAPNSASTMVLSSQKDSNLASMKVGCSAEMKDHWMDWNLASTMVLSSQKDSNLASMRAGSSLRVLLEVALTMVDIESVVQRDE
jgi:hypothetical protein